MKSNIILVIHIYGCFDQHVGYIEVNKHSTQGVGYLCLKFSLFMTIFQSQGSYNNQKI